jgi:predicted nicotinamide N-methyase
MTEPTTHRGPAEARTRLRADRTDPRHELEGGTIALQRGRIEFVHPREPMEVLYEQNFNATEEYPPYWAELWPSGIELAYEVSGHDLGGRRVLELGCGLGLPSIAAALAGARVLATDRSPDSTAFAASNAARSGAVLETALCAWDAADAVVARAPWDLVLAADVLYGHRNAVELLALLPRLVDGAGEVWIADPGRPLGGEFLENARVDWTVTTTGTRVPDVRIHRLRRSEQPDAPDQPGAAPDRGEATQ